MTALYEGGIRFILQLQALTWLEAPMRFFSFLGTADFFILILPVVYWCIDAGLGIRIGFILLFGNGLNELAKLGFHGPRPYWISAQVRALSAESSFGPPSGHAQIATGVWGIMAARLGRVWTTVLASLIVFLIGLSRMFLAVHFPLDVLVGWLLGLLTLWAFVVLWAPAASWVNRLSFLQQAFLALAVSLLFVILDVLLVHGLRGYSLPAEWLSNATRAGKPYPDPLSMEGALTSSGALLGLGVGLAWIQRRGGFAPSGPVRARALSFVLGLAGLLILYLGLSYVLPSDSSLTGSIFRLLRYALIGLWISAGAPQLFRILKLQRSDSPRPTST